MKPCDTGDEHAPRCAVQQPAFQRAMSVEDTLSVAHPPLSLHCPLRARRVLAGPPPTNNYMLGVAELVSLEGRPPPGALCK